MKCRAVLLLFIICFRELNTFFAFETDEFPGLSQYVETEIQNVKSRGRRNTNKVVRDRKKVLHMWKRAISELNSTWTPDVDSNKFAYLTLDELEEHCLGFEEESGFKPDITRLSTPKIKYKLNAPKWNSTDPRPEAIELINWDHLFHIPLKNQGFCNSCWAFIGVYCLEHWHMRNTGEPYKRASEQQQIACPIKINGCKGGDHRRVFEMNKVVVYLQMFIFITYLLLLISHLVCWYQL